MKTFIIGQGNWGRRLAEMLPGPIDTWRRGQPGGHIRDAREIYLAVPAQFLRETLERFSVDSAVPVVVATKGLDCRGLIPSELVREVWGSRDIRTLGGACISSEERVVIEYGDDALEHAGIIKNVYVIGFNYLRERDGINVAANAFVRYWDEFSRFGPYHADLVASCFSPDSRNARVGSALGSGREVDLRGQIAEGLHTACVIERFDLYSDLPELRNITRLLSLRAADSAGCEQCAAVTTTAAADVWEQPVPDAPVPS